MEAKTAVIWEKAFGSQQSNQEDKRWNMFALTKGKAGAR